MQSVPSSNKDVKQEHTFYPYSTALLVQAHSVFDDDFPVYK